MSYTLYSLNYFSVFIEKITKELNHSIIRINYDTRLLSWLGVGGTTPALIIIKSIDDLKILVQLLNDYQIPFRVIGRGSNVFFSDGSLSFVLIKLDLGQAISVLEDRVIATADVTISKFVRVVHQNHLTGVSFLAGIPATLGGAAFMNAGTKLGEIKSIISKLKAVSFDDKQQSFIYLPKGNHSSVKNNLDNEKKLIFSYRKSNISSQDVITHIYFRLKLASKDEVVEEQNQMKEYLDYRNQTQPMDKKTLGSTFTNPFKMSAGKLIEQCGLKNYSIGEIKVSSKHANFIENEGNAKSKDILSLLSLIEEKVQQKHNIKLTREIQYLS